MESTYHHKNLREDLINLGRKLIIRKGYENFSLRELAKELGVSHTAPYRHFESKEELLKAILVEDSGHFEQALKDSFIQTETPRERLMLLGEAYINFFIKNPDTLSLFNSLPDLLAEQGKQLLEHLNAEHEKDCPEDDGLNLLRKASKDFIQQYPGLSEKEVTFGFWAKVHGIVSLLAVHKDYFTPDELEDSVRRIVRSAF